METPNYKVGQQVEGVVDSIGYLGVNILIDGEYMGLAYKNEIFKVLTVGDKLPVYIKNIREDGKIDLLVHPPGYKAATLQATDIILEKLNDANGFLPYNDKTSPEVIYDIFQMSKKNFKLALSSLYKRRKIKILPNGIQVL